MKNAAFTTDKDILDEVTTFMFEVRWVTLIHDMISVSCINIYRAFETFTSKMSTFLYNLPVLNCSNRNSLADFIQTISTLKFRLCLEIQSTYCYS